MDRLPVRVRLWWFVMAVVAAFGGLTACTDDSAEEGTGVPIETVETGDRTTDGRILDRIKDPAEQEEAAPGEQTVPDDGEPAADRINGIRDKLLAGSWDLAAIETADALRRIDLTEQQRAEIVAYEQLTVAQIADDAEATEASLAVIAAIDEEFAGQIAIVAIGDYLLAERWPEVSELSAQALANDAIAREQRDELAGYRALAEARIDRSATGAASAFNMIEEVNPGLAKRLQTEGVFDFKVDPEARAIDGRSGG